MGGQNSTLATYLILEKDATLNTVKGDKKLPNSKQRYVCDYSSHCLAALTRPALMDIKDDEKAVGNDHPILYNRDFPFLRQVTLKRTEKRLISSKAQNQWFMFAIHIADTIGNKFIPESVRLSMLRNLAKLATDEHTKHDLRDSNSGQYLNVLSSSFDPKRPRSKDKKETMELIEAAYMARTAYDEFGCMTYKLTYVANNGDVVYKVKERNTAFIHDLIDPNKCLFNHSLWIPALFDCEYAYNVKDATRDVSQLIKSPILNLDYVKYRALYRDIGDVFKLVIQPSFEQLLNTKLDANEKVIVKSMKYILQKPGDEYQGCLHREGLGENIVAVSIYYPSIAGSDSMENGKLSLSLSVPDIIKSGKARSAKTKEVCHEFSVDSGAVITFYNEGSHQLKSIKYSETNASPSPSPISRTILAFFLISPCDKHTIPDSNHTPLKANIAYYFHYYIAYWSRVECDKNVMSLVWLNELVEMYLFGDRSEFKRGVYKQRAKMRKEKGKDLQTKKKRNIRRMLEGMRTFNINVSDSDDDFVPMAFVNGTPQRRQMEGSLIDRSDLDSDTVSYDSTPLF